MNNIPIWEMKWEDIKIPTTTSQNTELEILLELRKRYGSIFMKDNDWNPTFEVTVEIASFIETQIAQAEERGEERMKNEILKIIPCETAKSQLNTMAQNDRIDDENLILWQIRHWISCLWKDDSISSL